MRRRGRIAAAAVVTAAAAALGPAPAGADVLGAGAPGAVPGRYIVVLEREVGGVARVRDDLVRAHGADVGFTYRSALRGFSARMSAAAARRMAANPRVAYVEQEQYVAPDAVQRSAPWGLDRIDQRSLPLRTSYAYGTAGAGVKIYIIDTGIDTTHMDFGGRAIHGFDAVKGAGPAGDCHGHGTHVAGIAGGSTYGVAKAATLVPVRVLCEDGTTAQVIAGVDWVTADHVSGPAVANMSLGTYKVQAINDAVSRSIADGVVYTMSGGNGGGEDSCGRSPASTPEGITVGATTRTDARADFSNIGTCLDLFAPGVDIPSTLPSGGLGLNSGTSMAAPHVAGAAARVYGAHPDWTPQQVRDALVDGATTGVVTDAGTGSPNLLLYADSGNRVPVAADDAYGLNEDTNLTVPAPGVLANDSDLDADSLTAVLRSEPAHGTLVLWADGSFSYTPDAAYDGGDAFTYQVSDGDASSDPVTVALTIHSRFEFDGFATPIDNETVNTAKAGQTIPVEWRLTDHGIALDDPATFAGLSSQSGGGVCAGLPLDAIESYSGASGLQYLGDGTWQFNWKTPKSYAGQCRVMTLELSDGTSHTAVFRFG